MKLLTHIQLWGDRHHPQWLDFLRILLGLTLIWKGVSFARNLSAFTALMSQSTIPMAVSLSVVAHIIIAFHVLGGLFITIGSHTRMFCLLNLPILVVAVFFINLNPHIFRPYAELWLSCSVLLGLLCFLIEGDGVISVEHPREVARRN
jgi:putative oxidoreductase